MTSLTYHKGCFFPEVAWQGSVCGAKRAPSAACSPVILQGWERQGAAITKRFLPATKLYSWVYAWPGCAWVCCNAVPSGSLYVKSP